MNQSIQLDFNNQQIKTLGIRVAKIAVIFAFTLFLLYWILKLLSPFILVIVFGFLIYRVFNPMHEKIKSIFNGDSHPKLCAGISTSIVILGALIPLCLVIFLSLLNIVSFLQSVSIWLHNGGLEQLINTPEVPQFIKEYALVPFQSYLAELNLDSFIKNLDHNFLTHLGGNILTFSSYFFIVFLNLFLLVVVIFFGFFTGEKVLNNMLYLIPMNKEYKDRYLQKIDETVRSVIVGGGLTAVVQVLFGCLGFYFAGISVIWAFIMGFATAIPVVGAALIWIPVCLFLAVKGHLITAGVLALYCIVFVSSIDNLIRPWLIGLFIHDKKGPKHAEDETSNSVTIYVSLLFAILGGLTIFGAPGLIFGPIIFGLWKICVEIYKAEFHDILEQRNTELPDSPQPNLTDFESDSTAKSEL